MTNKECYEQLKDEGFFEYGAVTPIEKFHKVFGIAEIEYPAMKHEIQQQQIAELSASDYIRNRLLNEGKYFKGERDSYRVLIPSENVGQVLSYITSADNKLKRGLKLNANTPSEYKMHSQDEVRAILKQEYCKDEKRKAKDDTSGRKDT